MAQKRKGPEPGNGEGGRFGHLGAEAEGLQADHLPWHRRDSPILPAALDLEEVGLAVAAQSKIGYLLIGTAQASVPSADF